MWRKTTRNPVSARVSGAVIVLTILSFGGCDSGADSPREPRTTPEDRATALVANYNSYITEVSVPMARVASACLQVPFGDLQDMNCREWVSRLDASRARSESNIAEFRKPIGDTKADAWREAQLAASSAYLDAFQTMSAGMAKNDDGIWIQGVTKFYAAQEVARKADGIKAGLR